MSENDSFNIGYEESLHIVTPITNPFTSKINHHNNNYGKINSNQLPVKYCSVLVSHKSGKLTINSQFQQLIRDRREVQNIKNVSILGVKKIGKSFLLDSLLTHESDSIQRLMSKNQQQLINTPTIISNSPNGDRIIYLDNNGQPSPSMFLLLYYISTVMIYNLSPNNYNQQSSLIQCLVFVFNSLQSDSINIPLPKLIIIRRDVNSKTNKIQNNDVQLIRKIQEFGLFDRQIIIIQMPYPGTKGIMSKQLLDIPLNQLDKTYLTQIQKLYKQISQTKTKIFITSPLNTKTQSLVIQSILKSINLNDHQINSKKIWNDVDQVMAVNYYNQYLKQYTEQLQRQLSSQQPYDKYTLYKKLVSIKRKVNKRYHISYLRMNRYTNFTTRSIYQKSRQKVQQIISTKQQQIKKINKIKSRAIHQNNYFNLINGINSVNYQDVIDNYCQCFLDQEKTDVLVQNFQKYLVSYESNHSLINNQLQTINNQIKQLDKLLIQKQNEKKQKIKTQQILKTSIGLKQTHLQKLKSQYQNINKQSNKQSNKNSQIAQLRSQKQTLIQNIQNCQKQISNLKKLKQKKIKQTKVSLQQQLQKQQETYRGLKSDNNTKNKPNQQKNNQSKASKKTCCGCILI